MTYCNYCDKDTLFDNAHDSDCIRCRDCGSLLGATRKLTSDQEDLINERDTLEDDGIPERTESMIEDMARDYQNKEYQII